MKRPKIPGEVQADVLAACRRRCCLCFALSQDDTEKRGQVAHLDHDPTNNASDNLAFLCLLHHDDYDSRRGQSKGLTVIEVKRYRTELLARIASTGPSSGRDAGPQVAAVYLGPGAVHVSGPGAVNIQGPNAINIVGPVIHAPSTATSDADIVAGLTQALDRPAFRTPFQQESSLGRFQKAIVEAIETLNTGRTPQGRQHPAKSDIRDPAVRAKVDALVERLVALRASFDRLQRAGEVRRCGCTDSDCPIFTMSERAIRTMDRARQSILDLAHELNPALPHRLYDLD